MGIRIVDFQTFVQNYESEIKSASPDNISIESQFYTLNEHLKSFAEAFRESGGIEKRMEEEFGYYLPPHNYGWVLNALKELADFAEENDIKINGMLKRKIDRQYALWFPEQSEEHIKTMEYIRNTEISGYELFNDLTAKKESGELYFGNFEEVDYDDLVLLWHTHLIVDNKIKELYSLESSNPVTTKRKNLFISDARMAALDRSFSL